MRITAINTYRTAYRNQQQTKSKLRTSPVPYSTTNIQNDRVSFKGFNLKKYNPAYRFCMQLFERSQIASRRRISPPIKELEGKLTEVMIPLKGRRKIVAYDINPDNRENYIVFFHGTSQNISNCQTTYKEFLNSNYAVLAPEYSGFGKNKSRTADEYTLEEDIAAVVRYLKKKKIKPENTGIAGHSLGGFAATRLAEEIPQAKFLILISPVNTLSYEVENIVKQRKFKVPKIYQFIYKHYPQILAPLDRIFKTEERIAKTKIPLYIIHSSNDSLIPVKSSKELALKSKSLRELIILDGGGHRMDETKIATLHDILARMNVKPQKAAE